MPPRKHPLVDGEYYHIYNRGINKQDIFTTFKEYKRALALLKYYRHQNVPLKFSVYNRLNVQDKILVNEKLKSSPLLIELVCFCLMPNHFHLLMRSLQVGGVTEYVKNFQSGYSHYFNLRHDRCGSLYQGTFKNVHVVDDSQLLHLSRYIHLNPFSAGLLKDYQDLENFPWSSMRQFIGSENGFCQPDIVLSVFDLKSKVKAHNRYRQFVADQASYQRDLEKIKHLTIDL